MEASPSHLVFPTDGKLARRDTKLVMVLRRALGRAGLVEGWVHICRRKGCGLKQQAPDGELRRCPDCNMKLWPRPTPRPLRFHDLRGTTATLLRQSGVPDSVIAAILGHADTRITQRYAHVSADYLRDLAGQLRLEKQASFAATPSVGHDKARSDRDQSSIISGP